MMKLAPDLQPFFSSDVSGFHQVMQLEGDVYRALENRKTLRFERGGKGYFAKLHFGIGWLAFLNHLLNIKWPVFGARDEMQAIERLKVIGIDTLTIAGFGESEGKNAITKQSFIITDELTDAVSLEDYFKARVTFDQKRSIIKELALIVRKMHRNGINHRDCYLCHFYLRTNVDGVRLIVMDLHRAQCRTRVPRAKIIKDIAGLYSSAMPYAFTRTDYLYFVKHYSDDKLMHNVPFWRAVTRKAKRIFNKN